MGIDDGERGSSIQPAPAPGKGRGLPHSQQLLGDHHPLDLVGPLVDLHDLGVAHVPLHGKLPRVAHAAEDLHGVGGHVHRRVGGEALRHGGLQDGRQRAPLRPPRRAGSPPAPRSPGGGTPPSATRGCPSSSLSSPRRSPESPAPPGTPPPPWPPSSHPPFSKTL